MQAEEAQRLVIDALCESFDVHQSLAAKGLETIKKNQFGDIAIRADIETEQAVLRVLQRNKAFIRVMSEEHGTTDTPNAKYLGILDGIDGSQVYLKQRNIGHYGTMFAIFKNLNPSYDEYVSCGIMQHATNRLFYATSDKGAFVVKNGEIKKTYVSNTDHLDQNSRIYIDEYFETNRTTFSNHLQKFHPKCLQASAAHYSDLVEGQVDLVLECTRKQNLEIAVAYGLVAESGGVMVDIKGESIGPKKYLEFGQHQHIPIVTAANPSLAQDLINYIQSH